MLAMMGEKVDDNGYIDDDSNDDDDHYGTGHIHMPLLLQQQWRMMMMTMGG